MQPADAPHGSIEYVTGSYFAVVEEGSSVVGPDVQYVVKRPDGSCETVSRERLRRRVWHRVAFLGVTNEKQHVATTTQAFFSHQHEFWRLWHKEGRDAALAFAANDRACVDIAATATAGAVRADATTAAAAAATAMDTAATAAAYAAASSAKTIAATDPKFGRFLADLDHEKFWGWVGHSDNATHLKSSGNLHYWSKQQDTLGFIKSIWIQYGCPGKGKGPWDGLGAMVKTKVTRDITNERCKTPSGRIRSALEVAQHLRAIFCNREWLAKHAHMKIHELVVLYIDKDEKASTGYPRVNWPVTDPKYTTVKDISKKYCFACRGGGRVAARRWCCWCEACWLAFAGREGSMTPTLDIPDCKRRHLSTFKGTEETIKCTAAAGLANARTRAKALWQELKRNLKAGKFAAVQARELWSTEERTHLRPGHFWACQLGNFNGSGSPVIHAFTKKNESFEYDKQKYRGDEGEHLLLLKCYFHRIASDADGLSFMQWQEKKGEALAVNSSELRAVQGHQKNDFVLTPFDPPPPVLRQKHARHKKKGGASVGEIPYPTKQKWCLGPSPVVGPEAEECDRITRSVCEGT